MVYLLKVSVGYSLCTVAESQAGLMIELLTRDSSSPSSVRLGDAAEFSEHFSDSDFLRSLP